MGFRWSPVQIGPARPLLVSCTHLPISQPLLAPPLPPDVCSGARAVRWYRDQGLSFVGCGLSMVLAFFACNRTVTRIVTRHASACFPSSRGSSLGLGDEELVDLRPRFKDAVIGEGR